MVVSAVLWSPQISNVFDCLENSDVNSSPAPHCVHFDAHAVGLWWRRSSTQPPIEMDGQTQSEFGTDQGVMDAETDVFLGAPQCSDGDDNDGDGLIDLEDPGCDDALDNDERQRQCADGEDNDGDGLTDFPSDPGCGSPNDNDEEIRLNHLNVPMASTMTAMDKLMKKTPDVVCS